LRKSTTNWTLYGSWQAACSTSKQARKTPHKGGRTPLLLCSPPSSVSLCVVPGWQPVQPHQPDLLTLPLCHSTPSMPLSFRGWWWWPYQQCPTPKAECDLDY
jgi:hypothetical protein